MAVGMAAAVSDSLSQLQRPPRGCLFLPGVAGQMPALPPSSPPCFTPPSPFSFSLPPSLPSFPLLHPFFPAAALAGGGTDTRGCGLRPPSDPAPR